MFYLRIRRPPRPTPFPYPTLSRSRPARCRDQHVVERRQRPGRTPGGRHEVESPVRERRVLDVDDLAAVDADADVVADGADRKSTRLNSSHANISYAVFCLKKKRTA